MSQTTQTPSSPPSPQMTVRAEPDEVRQQLAGKHACPFCGVIRADAAQPCPRCTMEDTAATRGATRQRIGPWFVLQARNPSAPGMKFATLLQLVKKGHVTPRSIVRGPTSQQLWSFAARLRGLSREFGLCWHCGEGVEPTSMMCAHCGRSQEPPTSVDVLFEPAEPSPPDIMATARLPSTDSGMDGGTSLELQVSDAAPAGERAPIDRSLARPASPSSLPARRVERPIADRPLATLPTKEEGILTARELAAAFQLDFKMPGERGTKRKGSLLRTIAALLLITFISAGITLALRPDWRQQVFAAATDKFNGMKSVLEQPKKMPTMNAPVAGGKPITPGSVSPKAIIKAPELPLVPPPEQTSPPVAMTAIPSPAPDPVPDVTTPPAAPLAGEPPTVQPPKMDATPQIAVASPAPTQSPAPAPPVPTPPTPIPAPPLPPAPPTPAPTPPSPAPSIAPPADNAVADELSIDQAIDKASHWRNQAIDATARGDWAGAIGLYEKIEKLPRDAWPSDVELKLEMARKHAQ